MNTSCVEGDAIDIVGEEEQCCDWDYGFFLLESQA